MDRGEEWAPYRSCNIACWGEIRLHTEECRATTGSADGSADDGASHSGAAGTEAVATSSGVDAEGTAHQVCATG